LILCVVVGVIAGLADLGAEKLQIAIAERGSFEQSHRRALHEVLGKGGVDAGMVVATADFHFNMYARGSLVI
jgi:hypothetical protein